METIKIKEAVKVLEVTRAMLDGSTFNDVAMKSVKITNANLSDLEIEGAQLGGAFIHNVGMPPVGHPLYDATAKQRPLRFEDCYLADSTIPNCNLSGIVIDDCNVTGMKINGILLEDLLDAYNKGK